MAEVWLLVPVVALVINTIVRWWAVRESELAVHRIERVLEVWAQTWQDEAIRDQLLKALHRDE